MHERESALAEFLPARAGQTSAVITQRMVQQSNPLSAATSMCTASVAIRAGRSEDAPFLAWAILAASRGHLSKGWFDIALNQPEERCVQFLRQLTDTPTHSMWHYSRFLIAEVDGSPVAAVSAFGAADVYAISPMAITETIEKLGWPAVEQTRFWERGEYAFACTKPPLDDALVIESIATLPKYRSRGCIAALLAHALESGKVQGLIAAQITFLIGNYSAERAYLRSGFRLTNEWRHPDFEAVSGSPGLRRFVRAI